MDNAIFDISAAPIKRNYNRPLYGNKGEFTLARNITVPYFSTVMSIPRAVGELKTHEQVAPSLDQKFNLRELYQREIDQERVQKELIDGYLRDPKKLKFFNSLTIVLLPKTEQGHIASTFEDYQNNNPAIPYDPDDRFDQGFASQPRTIFGGAQYSVTANGIARLRWDTDRVDAVAVDGQHRLRALQNWFDFHKNKSLEEFEKGTMISIIILLLDKRAGFNGGDFGGAATKTIAREIFTDLNKNARGVDKATEIVLDDRSLVSCCVRRLVTDQTCCDSTDVLPLSLVRWKDANHRFDQEYFINSLVHLHLLVESLIAVDSPNNPMDENDAEKFIDAINERLSLPENNNSLVADGISLKDYFKEKYLDENEELLTPFSDLPQAFLPSALAGFDVRFKPWLIKFLMEFRPYKEILQYAREQKLIEGAFAQYLAQPKGHQNELSCDLEAKYGANWRSDLLNKHTEKIQAIKNGQDTTGDRWPFKSIFQKAMARLLKVVAYDNIQDKAKFGDVETFLEFFNALDAAGKLKVHAKLNHLDEKDDHPFELWTFTALNPVSGNIKVTKKVENRILATLALWYMGYRYAYTKNLKLVSSSETSEGSISVDAIADEFGKKPIQKEWPVNDFYNDLADTFEQSAYLIAGKDSRSDIQDVRSRKIARQRIVAIMKEGLEPFLDDVPAVPKATEPEAEVKI